MRREEHQRLHAASVDSLSLPAADCAPSSPPACRYSAQQAAAAWAWFERGGSSCISPSKAEGLHVASKGCAKLYKYSVGARPSRFKKEVPISFTLQGSPDDCSVVVTKSSGGPIKQRHHSFDHHPDLLLRTFDMYDDQRLSSSFKSTSQRFYSDVDGTVEDQDVSENEDRKSTNLCQTEACSLLDKFEVEAVHKQLHDRFNSTSCRSSGSSADLLENLKPHGFVKSCSTEKPKPSADNDHHHNKSNVMRRLLHLHAKMSSGHSTSSSPAPPFFCSSIATTNSIIGHRHRRSPMHSKADIPVDHTAKRQAALHKWGVKENIGELSNYTGETKLHQVTVKADKVSAVSALALSHRKHADKSWRDDGKLTLAVRAKRHHKVRDGADHVHYIHHHHHHHYHHLQQTNGAAGQRHRQNHHLKGHSTGDHKLQAAKFNRIHKDQKLMMSGAADQEQGRPQHHEYGAAGSLQATAKLKAEKYLWPAAHGAGAGTARIDVHVPTF